MLSDKMDYQEEAAILYTALSRMYSADNEQLDAAKENASVLSKSRTTSEMVCKPRVQPRSNSCG